MADKVVAGTGEATALGLESGEGKLFSDHGSANSIGEGAENFDARGNEFFLPFDVIRVKTRMRRLAKGRDLEARFQCGLEDFVEPRRHGPKVEMVHKPEGMRILIGKEDFVEREIAMAHGFPERQGQVGNAHPKVREFAIEKDFPVGVPAFDVLEMETPEQMGESLARTVEACRFASQPVETDERTVIAGGLDGSFGFVGLLEASRKIVCQ
jgi:hypothetical protein